MKLLFLLSVILAGPQLWAQTDSTTVIDDSFETYSNGSDGSPAWTPTKGLWQMIDGKYYQQSPEYDCATLLNRPVKGSYEFTVTFQYLEGDLGAGIVFSSYQKENTKFAQMVRFDGGTTFLMGYYQDGEFYGTASTKTDSLNLTSEHSLVIRIDSDNKSFAVGIDGKTIQADVPLQYRSGYLGLQNSGGRVRFHRAVLKSLPNKSTPSEIDWVKHFAMTGSNEFILPDERDGILRIIDSAGTTIRHLGKPAIEKGPLHHPTSVAILGNSTLVLADETQDQVLNFSQNGRWLSSVGGTGTDRGKFRNPSAIAVNSRDQIFIVDKGNNRIQVLDDSLRTLDDFGLGRLREPMDIAIEDSLIYVLNTGLSQVDIYAWDGRKAVWKRFISYGGGAARGIAVQNGNVFISVVNQLRKYDTTGVLLNTFIGRSLNFVLPWGISIDRAGMVYFADFSGGRIVRTSLDLLDPTPVVTFRGSSTASIDWFSADEQTGAARVINNDDVRTLTEEANSRHHHVIVDKLKPSKNYRFRVTTPLTSIPSAQKYSRTYSFISPPGAKKKQFVRLPMLAIIFQNVLDDKIASSTLPLQPRLPDLEISRIEDQIRDGIKFYWIKSGMNFFIDVEFLVVPDKISRSLLYGQEWWYPPRDSAINAILNEYKKDIRSYSSLLYLTCTQTWDSSLHKYLLGGKGGAFTSGVGTGKGYGISYWDVTRRNHNAGNNWLMVHEFNHQLDDIFMVSGYPEYWFNHISPTIGTAAKFGEHFDANGYIIGMVPREEWFDLLYTQTLETHDNDEDGIPDNDPRLPLDEVRLGSDTTKLDTDGDGVNDLSELSHSNWLTEGWGETFGNPIFPNLRERDSDGDGINDREDPLPCSRIDPQIYFGSPKLLGHLRSEKIDASISSFWTAESLCVIFSMNHPAPIKLVIDANCDGWFCGRDNYLLTLKPDSSDRVTTKVQIFNGTDPHQWPFMDGQISEKVHIGASLESRSGIYTLRVTIPRNDSLGLALAEKKHLGLLAGFLVDFDEDGNKRYLDIFEPNRFFEVTLIR